MSDDYIHIIPAKPDFVPDQARRHDAVSYFRSIAPKATEVSSPISDHLEFVHCGGNFGEIRCPSCKAVIEVDLWQGWMDDDYSEKGFALTPRAMPCCGAQHTLHDLAYE